MKEKIVLIMLWILTANQVFGQECFPEGITFSSQEEVDSFQVNYPLCTIIEGSVTITTNVENLEGLAGITAVEGNLNIDAFLLDGFIGLNSLKYIGGSFTINHTAFLQETFTGLDSLETIGVDFNLYWTFGLKNFVGLNSLLTIGGVFYVSNAHDLISFEGITNLISCGGLYIRDCDELINLYGLSNLSEINGYLWLSSNINLLDLSGIDNLIKINGDLVIRYHTNLISLNGLNKIHPSSIANLTIIYNYSLTTCHVNSVCGYLSSPGGVININNNSMGCNDSTEILDSCDYVNQINNGSINDISIFPNPARDKLYISNDPKDKIEQVRIYNHLGQIVLTESVNHLVIDIQQLNKGSYIIELVLKDFTTKKRLIVK